MLRMQHHLAVLAVFPSFLMGLGSKNSFTKMHLGMWPWPCDRWIYGSTILRQQIQGPRVDPPCDVSRGPCDVKIRAPWPVSSLHRIHGNGEVLPLMIMNRFLLMVDVGKSTVIHGSHGWMVLYVIARRIIYIPVYLRGGENRLHPSPSSMPFHSITVLGANSYCKDMFEVYPL